MTQSKPEDPARTAEIEAAKSSPALQVLVGTAATPACSAVVVVGDAADVYLINVFREALFERGYSECDKCGSLIVPGREIRDGDGSPLCGRC